MKTHFLLEIIELIVDIFTSIVLLNKLGNAKYKNKDE